MIASWDFSEKLEHNKLKQVTCTMKKMLKNNHMNTKGFNYYYYWVVQTLSMTCRNLNKYNDILDIMKGFTWKVAHDKFVTTSLNNWFVS
jgi:uncharacterized Rmd1/YagE family protein